MMDNIREIIKNLPLILSDSREAADVSMNRIITLVSFLILIISPLIVTTFFSSSWDKFVPVWNSFLTFFGAQTVGNVFKKVFTK